MPEGAFRGSKPIKGIVAVWGKRPEVVARLPIPIVDDKGRYRQQCWRGIRHRLMSRCERSLVGRGASMRCDSKLLSSQEQSF